MNDRERAIWAAAYGAAFAADFERIRDSAESIPAHLRAGELPTDIAVRTVNAELPGYIADLAVRRYREWKDTEDNDFGYTIR